MTVNVLKLIALSCMLFDHIGSTFGAYAPSFFRYIGRISFPLYVYFIARGCQYTRNINRYMGRLLLFAFISEVPYDLARNMLAYKAGAGSLSVSFFTSTNVFFTLFLGVFCISLYQKIKTKELHILLGLFCLLNALFVADFFQVDYGIFGVLWILSVYIANTKNRQLTVIFIGILYKYLWPVFSPFAVSYYALSQYFLSGSWLRFHTLAYFLFALLALPLLYCYNGKKGHQIQWTVHNHTVSLDRWLFYGFYPVHLAILAGAGWLLIL